LYQAEHNYYANYFSDGSGLVGVGYKDFLVSRGLTRGFAGVFEEIIFASSIAGAIEDAKK
jgi:hypothetical protein